MNLNLSEKIKKFNEVAKRTSKAEPGWEPILFESIIYENESMAIEAASQCDMAGCLLSYGNVVGEVGRVAKEAETMLYARPRLSLGEGDELFNELIRAREAVNIEVLSNIIEVLNSNCEVSKKVK